VDPYDELEDDSSIGSDQDEYEGFEYEIIRAIADGIAIAACDASIEGKYFRGS